MRVSILGRLLVTERFRRQADEVSGAGFAIPGMEERVLTPDQEPLLVTNMRGSFVPTRISKLGVGRYGFSECMPEEESGLLAELWRVLWGLSIQQGWGNRCTNLAEAVGRMRADLEVPRSVVVPYSYLDSVGEDLSREEADTLMSGQGYVTESGGVQVLVADLPPKKLLVASSPALVGYYTRVDDRVGVMFTRVNRTLYMVDEVA